MISKTIGFRGLAYFQTHPSGPRHYNDLRKKGSEFVHAFQGTKSDSNTRQIQTSIVKIIVQLQQKMIAEIEVTILVIEHSYWKWPFIVDVPGKNCDFPSFFVCLPEGTTLFGQIL